MIQRFATLFTVSAEHEYHGGTCDVLDFRVPRATAAILDGARALVRVVQGHMHVLVEVDAESAPTFDLTGRTLLFELRWKDRRFDNFTVPVLNDAERTPLFANAADPSKLAAPFGVILASGTLDYVPRLTTRPLTLQLTDVSGAVVERRDLQPEDAGYRFDIRQLSDGDYRVIEQPTVGDAAETRVLVGAEMRDAGPWGLLAVRIAASFAASPPDLKLSFFARSERLCYYVVARDYTAAEFDQLSVSDGGFGEDGRPAIAFERLAAAAFAADDLAPTLLGDDSSRIALFRSKDAVPRRARGYRKLQLNRNGDVLLHHLPLPAADQRRAQFVIHLSKPII